MSDVRCQMSEDAVALLFPSQHGSGTGVSMQGREPAEGPERDPGTRRN